VYPAQDLLDKLDWEGGLVQVIRYGVSSKQVPSEVEDQWEEAQGLILALQELEAEIVARLELSALDAQDEEWEDEFTGDDLDEDEN
jgi:hypothetical protein